MRVKTWALVLLTIQGASIFGSYVNPIGLNKIGRKIYIHYNIWGFIVCLIAYFFIETAGPTPEELAYLLEGKRNKAQAGRKDRRKEETSSI
jgi:hypothetical protein